MSDAGQSKWSLRGENAEFNRLAVAFVVSVALHLLVFGTYHTGKRLNWWSALKMPSWAKRPVMLTELFKKKTDAQAKQMPREAPLIYVDVSPIKEASEPPQQTQYYSDKNSKASNIIPTPKSEEVPKVSGTQEQIPKTEDVPQVEFKPLQPAPAPAPDPPPKPVEVAKVDEEELRPKPVLTPGDLSLGKPEPTPKPDQGKGERRRPRTYEQARAMRGDPEPPGRKMKQEGGVPDLNMDSLDAKATPYGEYDRVLIESIRWRWYTLLSERDYASDKRGKVVLQFKLHYDGRITELKVADNTVGEMLSLICQKAVFEPSPYNKWPDEMRRVFGDTRSIQFTFFYN